MPNQPHYAVARFRPDWVAVLVVLISPVIAQACSIPVFRYALERWESDRFQAIVYYQGSLAAEHETAVAGLEQQSVIGGGPLNIEVIRYDLAASSSPKLLVAEKPPADQPLPLVEVRARGPATRDGQITWLRRWQGPLEEAVKQPGVFDSPARQEMVRRILAGHSAVWLLIEPDAQQAQRDGAALQKVLDTAAQAIPPPQGIGTPGSELFAPVPLEIRFSVLAISHQDPAEARFLDLLSASAPEWKKDATYVVPVFGRGRALEVFSYSTLDPGLAEEIAAFICGACSCQVKQANPGFDLLLAANWEEKLFGTGPGSEATSTEAGEQPVASSASAQGSQIPQDPEYLAIPPGEDSPVSGESLAIASAASDGASGPRNEPSASLHWPLLIFGLAAVIVISVAVTLRMRGGQIRGR